MLSFRKGTDRACTRMFPRSSHPTTRTKQRRFLRLEPLEQRIVLSNYWVSPSGNDNNAGTSSAPWLTLQHAANTVTPGTTVNILAGSYTGFQIITSGTSASPITWAFQSGATITTPINTDGEYFGIIASAVNYNTINGVTITPGTPTEWWEAGIKTTGTPPGDAGGSGYSIGWVIENCTLNMRMPIVNVQSGDQLGINCNFVKGTSASNLGVLIQDNYVSGCFDSGIYVANSSSYYSIIGNTVTDCGSNGIHNNGGSEGGSGINTYGTIEDNIVHDCSYFAFTGLLPGEVPTSQAAGGQSLSFDGCHNMLITNNLIYDAYYKGISLYASDASGPSSYDTVVNNTVICGSPTNSSMTANDYSCMVIEGGATNATVINNIFFNYRLAGGSMNIETGGSTSSIYNYNIYSNYFYGDGSGQNFTTWLENYSWEDAHSFIMTTDTTVWTDPDANTWTLCPTSLAAGVGTSVMPLGGAGTYYSIPSTDIVGNPRPGVKGYDIGAYEYQAGPVAPTVTSEAPVSGATNVAVSTAPTATFNEAVQAGTISFTLKNSSGTVAGSSSYNSTTNVTTFTPTSALAYNTTYTATISGAQSASSVPMTAPFSWSFTTAAAVAPAVTSETPASGATGVAVSTTATATFNEAVQAGTISFTLKNSSGTVAGSSSYNSTTNVTTFTPTSTLAYSTTYTATISGAESTSGVSMTAPFSWSFTTAAAVAPAVTSETPGSGATSVAMSMAPTATFNEAMQANTISFTLKNSSGTVAGSASYNSTTNVTTFTPTLSLASSTSYTATISGAQSMSGVSMTAPFSWSFTTAAASSTISIWSSTAKPANPSDPDTSSVELGVQFYSDVSGSITGLRFYKGSSEHRHPRG